MQGVRKALTPRVVIMMVLVLVVVPLSPLLITGRWGWWEAWVYAILAIGGFVVSRALAARHNPGLLAERARFGDQPDAKPWDKILSPIVGIGAGLIPIVAGVDVLQGWSAPYSLAVKLLGLALPLVGYVWASYALIENAYFSGVVRLQADRGQRVVSNGPYAAMRHPGYAGALPTASMPSRCGTGSSRGCGSAVKPPFAVDYDSSEASASASVAGRLQVKPWQT